MHISLPVLVIVDDDKACRSAFVAYFQTIGYRVCPAANGRDALDRFSADIQIAVAAMVDVHMPHMDGIELAQELRKLRPAFPILFMSGTPCPPELQDEKFFFEKPLDLDVLAAQIRELVPSVTTIPPPRW